MPSILHLRQNLRKDIARFCRTLRRRPVPGVEGRPAILDIAAGRGHVIAYNFNPMHRDLNRSDFRLLWNAILNCKAILEPRAQ